MVNRASTWFFKHRLISNIFARDRQLVIILALLITASGCTNHPPITMATPSPSPLPALNQHLFSRPPAVIDVADITRLEADQILRFERYFNDPINQQTPAYERVANYLSILLERFQYSDKTLTATQALQTMSGNCLSLVLVTDAFAKLSGVQIEYQLLEQNPVYNLEQDLLIRSDHMRSVVTGPWTTGEEGVFKAQRSIRIDYFQTDGLSYIDRIPTHHKDSMYYSNIAVEFAAQKKYQHAFANAKQALQINPENLSALNTLGILHRRLGDDAGAELIYRHGARVHPSKPIFLRNLSTLLKSQGRTNELSVVAKEIQKLDSNQLAELIRTGREAEQLNDYDGALTNYLKALEIAPGLHELHFYSAVANYKKGLPGRAKQHLLKAIQQSSSDPEKHQYEQKLAALSSRKSS